MVQACKGGGETAIKPQDNDVSRVQACKGGGETHRFANENIKSCAVTHRGRLSTWRVV